MNATSFFLCAGLVLAQAHVSAYADEPAPGVVEPAAGAASAAVANESAVPQPVAGGSKGALADRQVPKLILRWECKDCAQNEKVLPLIEQIYTSDAIAQGYSVADSETAEIAITAYRQRPPGARVMFGAFSGRDVLATRVTFRGKEFVVKDYSANAFMGMNSLCAAVAQSALKHIVSSIRSQ